MVELVIVTLCARSIWYSNSWGARW